MTTDQLAIGILIAGILITLLGTLTMFIKMYVKVPQGWALIVNTMRVEPTVTFTGKLVLPVIHKKEYMKISLKTIEIDRNGKDGLICEDNIRADIKVTFFVRVNKTKEDVLKVAQAIGCDRASEQETVEELFSAKFSEALKTVGKQLQFIDLYRERDSFRDNIIRVIGDDLNGYILEDAAIDYLEQTPIELLDQHNILDSQGIRKITELTAIQNVKTNELKRDEQRLIEKKNVETREAMLELEKQQSDAEAKQKREITNIQSREQAETEKVSSEERLKSEQARIASDLEIAIQEENKEREIQVAAKNRERAVAIEEEKVTRVRQLEIVDREREVELQQIEKEKALEHERKAIADIIRSRIVVEKSVAEEEERIKEVREISEADRSKQVMIIAAEGEAQQALVKDIKAAEAAEQTSHHRAKEKIVLAQAHLESAERESAANKQLAEGMQAQAAASGLAEAKVQEAKAIALEKEGLAQAVVLQEKMNAQAKGAEKQGMANVRVKEADAEGEERQAMVAVKVRMADAEAIEKEGKAQANAIEERFNAEAAGLIKKFDAMSSMTENAQSHEEFRMRLDKNHVETMKSIVTNKEIAQEQATVLATALKDANIDIVGGDGDFFRQFVNALAVGKSIDATLTKSDTLQTIFKDHIDGKENLIQDIKDAISGGGITTDSLKNLSVTALINKLMSDGSSDQKQALSALVNSLNTSQQ